VTSCEARVLTFCRAEKYELGDNVPQNKGKEHAAGVGSRKAISTSQYRRMGLPGRLSVPCFIPAGTPAL
jgi:hypothetical protein